MQIAGQILAAEDWLLAWFVYDLVINITDKGAQFNDVIIQLISVALLFQWLLDDLLLLFYNFILVPVSRLNVFGSIDVSDFIRLSSLTTVLFLRLLTTMDTIQIVQLVKDVVKVLAGISIVFICLADYLWVVESKVLICLGIVVRNLWKDSHVPSLVNYIPSIRKSHVVLLYCCKFESFWLLSQ